MEQSRTVQKQKAGKKGSYVHAEEQRDVVYLTEDFLHLTDRKLKNFGIFIQTCIKTKQQTTVIEQISPISHPGRGLKLGPLSIPIRSFPLLGEKTSTSGSWDPCETVPWLRSGDPLQHM